MTHTIKEIVEFSKTFPDLKPQIDMTGPEPRPLSKEEMQKLLDIWNAPTYFRLGLKI